MGNTRTPTEEAILNVLSDGEPHKREDLYPCLADPMYARFPKDTNAAGALRKAIYRLRRKLEEQGHTIVCQSGGARGYHLYRWVRLLPTNGH